MIDVEDITTLVGKRVVNQYGEFGTIDKISDHPTYPILVIFDGKPGRERYMKTGMYYQDSNSKHITLEEDYLKSSIDNNISETMTKYNLSAEELIAIILERHCE
jgi:hypothetical protein